MLLRNGHDKCIELLAEYGADVNKSMNVGVTPVYIASQKGHDKCIEVLVKCGADVNKSKNNGATPVYIASCEWT